MVIIKPFINLLPIKWVILYIPEENSKEPYKILSKIGLIDINIGLESILSKYCS